MIEIKDLLLGINDTLLTEEVKRETIRSIISEVIRAPIKRENIKIKNGTVFLNIKPIYKNEIFLKREAINFLLEKSFGKKAPQGIR